MHHLKLRDKKISGNHRSWMTTHYIFDLEVARKAYKTWERLFPKVTPYYAVKCNPDHLLIHTLAELGARFDCASPAEIDLVERFGTKNIIYANPCKRTTDIVYAEKKRIIRTTFDSICELEKMAQYAPTMELVLRIRADDPTAVCTLGNKYGAGEYDWDILALRARQLGLDITGVSFHIGSGARSVRAYADAIYTASRAFDTLRENGFNPQLIDIGGGFSSSMDLEEAAMYIHDALKDTGLDKYEVIAEPGRYFAEQIATLYTPVIGVKPGAVTIDESLYGAFNCILMDHAEPEPDIDPDEETESVTLFGSTCDGADIISKNIQLPMSLKLGDMLKWKNMGAYTMAATTHFNGIPFDQREIRYIHV
jgi:ornithine decarboxylase